MLRAFDGGRLFGHVHGSLPARVLALHGWRMSSAAFDDVLDGLDAVALDLPGFGASPEPPEVWGSADYASAVARALPEIGRQPVVVGHSFGGRVAVMLAAAHPEAVGALVLTGVPLLRGRPRPPAPLFRVARWLNRRRLLSEPMMERVRNRYGSDDYSAASGLVRAVLVRLVSETYEQQLAELRCPVHLVWGEKDDTTKVAVARWAAERIPDARLTIVPGVGHFVPSTAPDALRAAIDEALADG